MSIIKYVFSFSLFLLISVSYSIAQPNNINPNGYNVLYFDNGEKSSEGTMRDGKPDGYWKTYYKTGVLKSEGNRREFLLDSVWKFYNEEGKIVNEITYVDNKKNGVSQKYNKDGVVVAAEIYVDNKRAGFSKYFYDTGELKKMIHFENDKESGVGYEYAKDGRVISEQEYSFGYIRKNEKVNRYDRQDRKTGLWKEYYEPLDGEEFTQYITRLEGRYIEGEKDGIFREYKRDGSLVELSKFVEGTIEEDAEELIVLDIRAEYREDGSIKSVGGYKENKKQGVHREYDSDGKITNGFLYEDGEVTAEGIIDAAGTYQGNWKVYYPTGELKVEGAYKEGVRVGDWTFYHKNGKTEQKGKYLRGKPHGEWKWYYDDGSLLREESYRKGIEDGFTMEYDRTGEIITKGEYIDGYKEGEWFYKVGDHTEVGSYVADMKTGPWVHTYDNGKSNFKGEFLDGNENGKHKYWFRNGKVMMEGKYTMGLKDGEWKYYNEEGLLIMTAVYDMGVEKKIDGYKLKNAFDADTPVEESTEQ